MVSISVSLCISRNVITNSVCKWPKYWRAKYSSSEENVCAKLQKFLRHSYCGFANQISVFFLDPFILNVEKWQNIMHERVNLNSKEDDYFRKFILLFYFKLLLGPE